jgi:hypothetical protein
VDFRAFLERWNIPVEDWLLEESKSVKKGGNSNGSTDFNGAFRAG